MRRPVFSRAALIATLAVLLAAPVWAQKSKSSSSQKESGRQTTKSSSSAQAMPSGIRIDLNSATEQQLKALPGVGPATAKKIIKGRPYANVDDVLKAGVSKSTLDKFRSMVGVSAAAAAPSRPEREPSAGGEKK